MQIDDQSVQQNQELLGNLIDNGDRKFVGAVGVTALALLAEEIPSDEFKEFLNKAIEKAHELQKYKSLNAKQPKQPDQKAAVPQQPTPAQ